MANPNIPLPSETWVDVNTESAIDAGTELFIQNICRIDLLVTFSQSEPTDESSFKILPPRTVLHVAADSPTIWIKAKSSNGLIDIDINGYSINSIPPDVYTADNLPYKRRVKVSTATAQESLIANGDYFVGATFRQNIPNSDEHYAVLTAPANKYLIIEDAIVDANFANATNGLFQLTLEGYSSLSNGNAFTHVPVAPIPVGRALNTEFINVFPESTIDDNLTMTVTGVEDYPLFFADYFIDSQGNRSLITLTQNNFFSSKRQIIVSPNSKLLIKTTTSGDAGGTMDLHIIFFTTEIDETVFPKGL